MWQLSLLMTFFDTFGKKAGRTCDLPGLCSSTQLKLKSEIQKFPELFLPACSRACVGWLKLLTSCLVLGLLCKREGASSWSFGHQFFFPYPSLFQSSILHDFRSHLLDLVALRNIEITLRSGSVPASKPHK